MNAAARILRAKAWRDLVRTPGASVLVVVAVALATTLGGIGVALGLQAASSADALLATARAPHLVQMHAGALDRPALDAFVAQHPEVTAFDAVELVGLDSTTLELTPGRTEASSSVEYSVTAQHRILDVITDLEGRPAVVAPGAVGVPVDMALARGMKVGDPLVLNGEPFRVGALVRDAIMASDLTSSRRLLVHEDDLAALRASGTGSEWLIEFRLAQPDQATRLHDAYLAAGLPTNGPAIDAAMFRLMAGLTDGLIAASIVVVAALLALISALVLSITVRTAIAAELRPIGVLRAVGLPARALRRLVLLRHAILVVAGALLGALVALVAIPVTTASVRLRMGGDPGLRLVLGVAAVAALAVLGGLGLARASLRPALRAAPLTVIRGQLGRPGRPRRTSRRAPLTALRLGMRQMRRSPADHAAFGGIVLLATVLAILPLSLRATLADPGFLSQAGLAASDVRIDLRQDARLEARLTTVLDAVGADPDVARRGVFRTVRVPARDAQGAWTGVNVESGDHQAFGVDYRAGRAPTASGEVALSELNTDTLGARLGGTLVLNLDGRETPHTVVGVYRDISNGGRTAKAVLPAGVGAPLWVVVHLDLVDDTATGRVVERYAALAAPARVTDNEQARHDLLGSLEDALTRVTAVAVTSALGLTGLLGALVLRLFLTREAARRAVAQALGASLGQARRPYLVRLCVPAVVGAALGVGLLPLLGRGLMGAAGSFFGAGGLTLSFTLAVLVWPVVLLAVVAVVVVVGVTRLAPSQAALLVAGQDL